MFTTEERVSPRPRTRVHPRIDTRTTDKHTKVGKSLSVSFVQKSRVRELREDIATRAQESSASSNELHRDKSNSSMWCINEGCFTKPERVLTVTLHQYGDMSRKVDHRLALNEIL